MVPDAHDTEAWRRFAAKVMTLTPEQAQVVSALIDATKASRGLNGVPVPGRFPRRLGTGPLLRVL